MPTPETCDKKEIPADAAKFSWDDLIWFYFLVHNSTTPIQWCRLMDCQNSLDFLTNRRIVGSLFQQLP
jgi:hypothetical protein